jgi:ABC-type phosphate transport system substrate-binding protein
MDMSLQKPFGRTRPALVGLVVLGCCLLASLMLADVSSAAYKPPPGVPPAGLNCVASDGKINGRGASYQAHAETIFAEAYRDTFCGNTSNSPEDAAGNTMVAYNYPESEKASATGAGAGIKAAICRTDAYAGGSSPYTNEQLVNKLDGPVLTAGTAAAEKEGCDLKFSPPFAPLVTANGKGEFDYPSTGDITAPIMSFPVAATATTVAVNLTGGSPAICTTKVPTSLSLTAKEVSRIFGGDALTWADEEIDATNPILKTDGCTGPITRVVRSDSSGTTEIFKTYLEKAANELSGAAFPCDTGTKWSQFNGSNNQKWPEGAGCSTLVKSAKSGAPEEIAAIKANAGGVGYADLPDEAGSGLLVASVQNQVETSFQSPAAGKGANCNVGVVSLPGDGSTEGAVGLDLKDNWSSNNQAAAPAGNEAENHQSITWIGAKYPICGITFDFVYTGLANGAVANAIAPLTADQRRTLYSYFSFIETTAAQSLVAQNNYAALPQSWVSTVREGFQENF